MIAGMQKWASIARQATRRASASSIGSTRSYNRLTEPSLAYAILPNYERGTDFVSKYNNVSILGAPFSDGQPFSGPDEGPHLLRDAGLYDVLKGLRWRLKEHGDLQLPGSSTTDPEMSREDADAVGGMCYQSYAVGNACEQVYNAVSEIAAEDTFPLILGGDHSLGMGIVPGILSARPNTAVIWVDAHADVNTPATSGSGNMHGMPLAFATENGIPYDRIPGCEWMANAPKLDPKNLVYIGLRDVDVGERRFVLLSCRSVEFLSKRSDHGHSSNCALFG